jgi:hypothetical protein
MFSRITDFFRGIGASAAGAATDSADAVEYEGFTIRATFRRNGAQWMTAGVITKEFADGVKEHRFIRADSHASKEGAEEFSITKAKQIIDEQGDRMFRAE